MAMLHLLLPVLSFGLRGALLGPATPTQRSSAPPSMRLRDAAARAAARAAHAGVVEPTNRHQAQPTTSDPERTRDEAPEVVVQGGSLRTWSHRHPAGEKHITLGTNGRPLDADVEVWDGPDNTPVSMRVYGEDGLQRPVRAVVRTDEARRGTASTVALRNAGPLEFPMAGSVEADAPRARPSPGARDHPGFGPNRAVDASERAAVAERPHRVQGGADLVLPIDACVDAIQVHLSSDGLPISARIEILQGPQTTKQGIEVYSDDGGRKPVTYVLETPGFGCVIQIDNLGPMEYPLTAEVVPHSIGRDAPHDRDEVVVGGVDQPRRRDPYAGSYGGSGGGYGGGGRRDAGEHWQRHHSVYQDRDDRWDGGYDSTVY